jgi:Uma2 family endonuclease
VTVFLGGLPSRNASLALSPPFPAIEIVSSGAANARRDLVDKLNDYRGAGVRQY